MPVFFIFFFQAEDGIRDYKVTGVETCALPICARFATGRGDGGGQLFVIESRLLRRRPDIHHDELRAASYRPRIPEMVRLANPVGRARNIHHPSTRLFGQRLAALIIGQRALRPSQAVPQQQRPSHRGALPSHGESHALLLPVQTSILSGTAPGPRGCLGRGGRGSAGPPAPPPPILPKSE